MFTDRLFYQMRFFCVYTSKHACTQDAHGNILDASESGNDMEILGKLLGGIPRVKIMRLFLLNPEGGFEMADIINRCRLLPTTKVI